MCHFNQVFLPSELKFDSKIVVLYIKVGKIQVESKVKNIYVVWGRGLFTCHLIGSVPEDAKLFDLFN